MNEQLAYYNECPEGHMAPDKPTDIELQITREDYYEYSYEDEYLSHFPDDWFEAGGWVEGVVQPQIECWRTMPNKTMQDCMRWLGATCEWFYGYGGLGVDEVHGFIGYDLTRFLIVESKALSLCLIEALKEARTRHNVNGQYDDDIARYQEALDSTNMRLDFDSHLGELVELLEKHGHDKAIFRLALELIEHKLHGTTTPAMKEILREIYTRLLGFD